MATARPRPQVMRLTEAAADRIKELMAKSDRPIAGLRVGQLIPDTTRASRCGHYFQQQLQVRCRAMRPIDDIRSTRDLLVRPTPQISGGAFRLFPCNLFPQPRPVRCIWLLDSPALTRRPEPLALRLRP